MPNFTPSLLIIGYGNTLRGDDGVGQRVAEAVEALLLPGVRTIACHQLSPELAEAVAQAGRVIFVDASVDEPRQVQLREIAPGTTTQLVTHSADPRTLLALAREVYGRAPLAWCLTIPAVRMEFGEELSADAQTGLKEAVAEIRRCAQAGQ